MSTAASTKPLTGRTVLVCLLAFFGIVIGVNGVALKLAIDTLPGTDVDSAYRASLAYNAEIEAAAAQSARGWSVVGHVEREPDGHAAVKVEARDAGNAPLTGFTFSARLSRPTDKRADRATFLHERESGTYLGTLSDLAPGQWDLVIAAERGDERVFLSRNRVVLR
jgi:nitrogen fixation protein FixH